jgi:putative tryptophan/tyrosine transport system substrate-binding protein
MNRRAFVTGLGAVLAAPLVAVAQQTARVYRIGILESSPLWEPFHQRLRELGYIEGRNLTVNTRRVTEGKPEQMFVMAQELVQMNVEVIATGGAVATGAAKRATRTIPIVMIAAGDPVGIGLVQSLARPGGNVTGLSVLGPETAMKRLELLKDLLPRLSKVALLKVALLWNASNPANRIYERDTSTAARSLNVTILSVPVAHPGELEQAFVAIQRDRPTAMIATGDLVLQGHMGRVIEFARRTQLPVMYQNPDQAKSGGLLAYGANFAELFRRGADYTDKILKGAKPAELPVEQPTKFELVINLRTAKALGLTIPPSLLLRADQVIE